MYREYDRPNGLLGVYWCISLCRQIDDLRVYRKEKPGLNLKPPKLSFWGFSGE